LPLGASFGRSRRSAGESLDGGLLEFDEFSPSRRFNSAFSARSDVFSVSSASTRASSISTWRSRRSMRASVELTHSLDHADRPESIETIAFARARRSGLHPVNGYSMCGEFLSVVRIRDHQFDDITDPGTPP